MSEQVTRMTAQAWEMKQKDPTEALEIITQAVALARNGTDRAVLAPALAVQGVCAANLLRHEDARSALLESLALCRQIGDLDTEGRCLHCLGYLHYTLAEYAEADERIRESLQIREDREDWTGMGSGYTMLGNIQADLCDHAAALDWYERGLAARERAGATFGVIQSLCNLGALYGERGEPEEALRHRERALGQAIRAEDSLSQVFALSGIGSDYVELGRYDECIAVCVRAIALGERLGSHGNVAATLTSLGDAYKKKGSRDEALEAYTRALTLARSVQESKVETVALLSIGAIFAEAGELDPARARLAEASALAVKTGAKQFAYQAFQKLSQVCKQQGDYAAALGHFEAFQRLEKEVFTEEADLRTKSLIIKMEVEHHRREAEALSEINTALQEANARLEALATTDPLTGLPNHRTLVAALDAETARVRRNGKFCSLLFLDVDHFKKFNDTHGHSIGDAVLSEFAACVSACLREEDTLGRWGGEEFLALLPGVGLAEALEVGERVRDAVAGHPLKAGGGLRMTCSIGAAACPAQEASRQALVDAADTALYAAKRLGRNQVRGAGDPAILALDGQPLPGLPGLRGPQHPALPPQTAYRIGANDQRHRED